MSLQRKGRKMSKEARIKIGLASEGNKYSLGKNVNEESANWKGMEAKYCTKHSFVSRKKGKPLLCSLCGKTGGNRRRYNWANIDHEYSRNLNDYIRLCVKCHKQYDNQYNCGSIEN